MTKYIHAKDTQNLPLSSFGRALRVISGLPEIDDPSGSLV